MNRLCWVLLAITAAASASALPVSGQSRNDGSLYSRYLLGELRSFPSSRAQAMGGGGHALWSLNFANYANPAALSRQFMVRASGGMRFDNISTSDRSSRTKQLRSGSFSALQFGLPLKSNSLGLGFAFEPFSRMNYRVTATGDLALDPTRSDTPYTIVSQGTGGLQQLRLGVGYRIASRVSVGTSLDYLFGILEESRRTSFASPLLIPTNLASTTRMRGLALTTGVIAAIAAGEEAELSAAASITLPATLAAHRVRTVGESLDSDTLGTLKSGDITLPARTAIGIAYATRNTWTFTADWSYAPWTRFESDVELSGLVPGALRDRQRLSAGVEYLPAAGNVQEPYLERIAYRLGFYIDNGYISPVAGQDITTRAVTAGFSLPTMFGGTRLDINLQIGQRGSTSGILVRDRFVTLSATLNVGERWFLKRRLG